ncbi:retroviral-like aspartic protease family protein [Patescibacteria group bacterium]|nr:retroviral-like aspartic protease family protein [Patescibacteria group bacterium]
MSSGHVFPYGITLSEGGIVTTFPAVEVGFVMKEGEHITLFLLVDSGAVISVLPKSDAEALGIQAEEGAPFAVAGIDGKAIQGWRHEVPVLLENEPYNLPVVFLENSNVPRILGRQGVFDKFTVVFEENKQRSALANIQSKEAQAIGEGIDAIARK